MVVLGESLVGKYSYNFNNHTYNYTGWWLSHPSEKYELVNWDDDIPNIWKNNSHVPVTTNQHGICLGALMHFIP